MIKRILLILICSTALLAQRNPDKPFPGHETPPEGWQCQHQTPTYTVDPEHVCMCHRECAIDDETGELRRQEDAKCKTWCHSDHCSCVFVCEEEEGPKV